MSSILTPPTTRQFLAFEGWSPPRNFRFDSGSKGKWRAGRFNWHGFGHLGRLKKPALCGRLRGTKPWQTSSLSPRGGDFIRIVEWALESTHENEVQDWLTKMRADVEDSVARHPHLQKRVTKERQKEKRKRKTARKAAAQKKLTNVT